MAEPKPDPSAKPPLPTYWDYIRVEELIRLQTGLGDSERELGDDEVRFIVIHQIDELWMKLVIRELVTVRDLFRRPHVPETSLAAASKALRRIALVFELIATHFRLMETMRTQDYLRFRDKLSPASGFQSAQMREIEILLGLDDRERVHFGAEKSYEDALKAADGGPSPALERVQRRKLDQPSLKEAVHAWLSRTPIDGSRPTDPGDREAVGAFVERFLQKLRERADARIRDTVGIQALTPADHERLTARYRNELQSATRYLRAEDVEDPAERLRTRRLRAAILFVESNRELPLLSWPGEIIDALIEAEQSMIVFRQRHARMVERVIGRRIGTGGSDGVDYIDQTALRYRVFKEIWASRTLLMRPEDTPPVLGEDYYRLRGE